MTNFSEFPQLDTSIDPAPLGIFIFFFGSEVGRQIPLRIAVLSHVLAHNSLLPYELRSTLHGC